MSRNNGTSSIKTILITGANSGLGKDAARQLAMQNSIEKIYLGCRNEQKAIAAKRELEAVTGRSIFEILLIDVSSPESARTAVSSLNEPIDALIMNAGGMGGTNPGAKTADGVIQMFAVNVLGHYVLLDELIQTNKLTQVAIYAGSEAARGIPMMGMKRPNLKTSSVEEFASIVDGSYFGKNIDVMGAYGLVKYVAALWMSSVARQNPNLRIVTVSPGGTTGTNVMDDLPQPLRFIFKAIGVRMMPLFGMMHALEVGSKRYVDVLHDASFKSGLFYASKSGMAGALVDQGTIFSDLHNQTFQDNANKAIRRFVPAAKAVA